MTKGCLKIYLEERDIKRLQEKARTMFEGRGAISRYITKVCQSDIVFIEDDVKVLIRKLLSEGERQ